MIQWTKMAINSSLRSQRSLVDGHICNNKCVKSVCKILFFNALLVARLHT